MRKLIAWNVATLDGYFEGETPWDLSFHETIWGKDLEELSLQQLENMDMLLFGRKTYQGMADHWRNETGAIADHMNALPKLVVSTTLDKADWHNTRLIATDPASQIRALKNQSGKDIYVFGSAQLLDSLLRHTLVDEYRLGIAPVLLGKGNPLFKSADKPRGLDLIEARPLDTGGILARYTFRPS